jgi:hypothetical protein
LFQKSIIKIPPSYSDLRLSSVNNTCFLFASAKSSDTLLFHPWIYPTTWYVWQFKQNQCLIVRSIIISSNSRQYRKREENNSRKKNTPHTQTRKSTKKVNWNSWNYINYEFMKYIYKTHRWYSAKLQKYRIMGILYVFFYLCSNSCACVRFIAEQEPISVHLSIKLESEPRQVCQKHIENSMWLQQESSPIG